MEYRVLPHGAPTKRFSTLGLGLGGIQQAPAAEIRQVIETAIAHGINFFDLCAGAAKTYAPFGQAIRGRREQVFFQLHLGAVYNESGEYGWSRELSEIQRTFACRLRLPPLRRRSGRHRRAGEKRNSGVCPVHAPGRAGDALAASHYGKLSVNASACISCGHCAARCPFGVDQPSRMEEIARYFA